METMDERLGTRGKLEEGMRNEPYFRCNNKKRHLVPILVCLHKKCPKTDCGFYRRAVASGDSIINNIFIPSPINDVKPIKGIKASRKRGK